MTTIVIRPKNKTEKEFLSQLLKKMNIETQFVEEPVPNDQNRKSIIDVENNKGTKVKDSQERFSKWGI